VKFVSVRESENENFTQPAQLLRPQILPTSHLHPNPRKTTPSPFWILFDGHPRTARDVSAHPGRLRKNSTSPMFLGGAVLFALR